MDGVIFNFMDNKAFYIKFFFLVFGIVLVLLGQYVFPNVKDKSLSDLLSNISFFLGIGILVLIWFLIKK
ncbi:hypothetical protein BZG42_08995 [Streptococcus sp. DAT741]|nr:hypothetical protein BZG42_08995 [Streptococcus sp. DAT741]